MAIVLISYFLYETKDFFNSGGFSNPIACSLYRMNISILLAYIIPEDMKPLMRIFKMILYQFSGGSPGKSLKEFSLLSNFTPAPDEYTRRRSRSRGRPDGHYSD